ncbi:MAG: hypothetical protein ABI896_04075 [Actinomycetota bacterium]
MSRIVVLLALAAGLALTPLALSANQVRVASHCSTSGDVCYGIFKDNGGIVRFQLTLQAKYFSRYRVCVRPLGTTGRCKSFPVKKVGANWGGKVIWNRNYPPAGPRKYIVTWKQSGRRLGPSLSFVLPAPA